MQISDDFQPAEWSDKMATGIAAIDKQHQYLFDTLQEANDKLLDSGGASQINQITKDLLGYAIMHFQTEEVLMKRYGYEADCPEEAQAHIAQHRDFSRQIVDIRNQLHEGHQVSRKEILKYLNHWLTDHVLGVDQLLGQFLVQKKATEIPPEQ